MEFLVSRTSICRDEVRPCKGSVKKDNLTYMDWRTVKTLEECKTNRYMRDFLEDGINHREENGMIVRELPNRTKWTIEINSLEKLLDFVNKNAGQIVINKRNDIKEYEYEIEIYDGYRE